MVPAALALSIAAGSCLAQGPADQGPRALYDLNMKDFVIGAWWGPGPTDAEMKIYRECGFNTVMTGRYMQLDDYGKPDATVRELDLARKHGLGVFFDTYTKNERPWGGIESNWDEHAVHHSATLPELQWLHGKIGGHPALIGYLLGDDYGALTPQLEATNAWMRDNTPHLFPWICQNSFNPESLAGHGNPVANPQIYPTLYSWQLPTDELARQYCAAYAGASAKCRDLGLMFWPMFNVAHWTHGKVDGEFGGWCPSDSLVRFPAYVALAYGAQGIWYFTYGGGAVQRPVEPETVADVREKLTPLYPVIKKANRRIAAWGLEVMGRTSTGLFGTAFGAANAWPFESESGASAEGLMAPAAGKLVEAMDGSLLVGILTLDGEAPLAMVVDCRTSKQFDDLKPRRVTVTFADCVAAIRVLKGKSGRVVEGRTVSLKLDAGEGQMLELSGDGVGVLCTPEAINAVAGASPTEQRRVTAADLKGATAGKLRIDVFGANAEDEYDDKFIDLNGAELARVPAGGDSWNLRVVDLPPERLAGLGLTNTVTVRNECSDAWKFRNVTLTVQLADGSWVKSRTDATVHSVGGWAHSEGEIWGEDGTVGPIEIGFN